MRPLNSPRFPFGGGGFSRRLGENSNTTLDYSNPPTTNNKYTANHPRGLAQGWISP
jgi:hypothetical protein